MERDIIKTTIHLYRDQWIWLRRATERKWIHSATDGIRIGIVLLRQEMEKRHSKRLMEE